MNNRVCIVFVFCSFCGSLFLGGSTFRGYRTSGLLFTIFDGCASLLLCLTFARLPSQTRSPCKRVPVRPTGVHSARLSSPLLSSPLLTTASVRSQWALPDLNSKLQIAVGILSIRMSAFVRLVCQYTCPAFFQIAFQGDHSK